MNRIHPALTAVCVILILLSLVAMAPTGYAQDSSLDDDDRDDEDDDDDDDGDDREDNVEDPIIEITVTPSSSSTPTPTPIVPTPTPVATTPKSKSTPRPPTPTSQSVLRHDSHTDIPTRRTETPGAVSSRLSPTRNATPVGVVVTDVTVNRSVASVREPVGITVTVANPHSTARLATVRLGLFGEIARVRQVRVPANGQRAVAFVAVVERPGTYRPSASGETATFRVVSPTRTGRPSPTDSPDGDGRGISTRLVLVGLVTVGGLAALGGRWLRR